MTESTFAFGIDDEFDVDVFQLFCLLKVDISHVNVTFVFSKVMIESPFAFGRRRFDGLDRTPAKY